MITQKDDLLHEPSSSTDYSWAETNYFCFCIPQEGLNGELYALFRPNLKVVLSGVWIWKGFLKNPNQADFMDNRVHLLMPEGNLDNYGLANGLSVKILEPLKRYQVDYNSGAGTEVHLIFDSLMPPFDIHDASINPLASDRRGALKGAFMGHFDQTGGVKGELILNEKSYSIDHPNTRDHSWGPRNEAGLGGPMQWDCGHFDKDFAFHIVAKVERNLTDTTLLHGYILENGKVYGLVKGKGQTTREGYEQREISYELIYATGRRFFIKGEAISLFPWMAWPNVCVYTSLTQWECEGKKGYGDAQHAFPISYIRRRKGLV